MGYRQDLEWLQETGASKTEKDSSSKYSSSQRDALLPVQCAHLFGAIQNT